MLLLRVIDVEVSFKGWNYRKSFTIYSVYNVYKDVHVTVKLGSSLIFPSVHKQESDLNPERTHPKLLPPREALGKKSSAADEALKGAFIVNDYHILTHISYQLASMVKDYHSDAMR